MCRWTWMLMGLALLAGTVAAAYAARSTPKKAEPELFIKLNEQVPMERVLYLQDVTTQFGPGKIWICNDPDCPEGCNSKPPNLFGNGLILEESRKLEEQAKQK